MDVDFGDQTQGDGRVGLDDDGGFQLAVDARIDIAERIQHKAGRVAREGVVRIGGALEGVDDIFGGQRLAVMAGQPFVEGKGISVPSSESGSRWPGRARCRRFR